MTKTKWAVVFALILSALALFMAGYSLYLSLNNNSAIVLIRSDVEEIRDEDGLAACTRDLRTCDDGSSVGRDPQNNCEFYECPDAPTVGACTLDVRACPDGETFVSRDPSNNCEFEACP